MATVRGVVLVTGAAGFIGQALCKRLLDAGVAVRAVVRAGGTRISEELAERFDSIIEVEDLAGGLEPRVLRGITGVVHLAGRAVSPAPGPAGRDRLFRDNLDAAVALARSVERAGGVERFIFLSTIKVNGEGVMAPVQHPPYSAMDPPRPQGAYAVSKWRAEQELEKIFAAAGTRLVIIRPPLVLGKTVGGNLVGLGKWLEWGLPLPIAVPENRRSLISRETLVEFVADCLSKPLPDEKVLLVKEQKDWSTAELARFLASGRRPRFLRMPGTLLRLLLSVSGKPELYRKLYGSLLIEGRSRI